MTVIDNRTKGTWKMSQKCTAENCGMLERTFNLLYNHVAAWKRVASTGKTTLILEDDARFGSDFVTYANQVFEDVKNRRWDVIWPGYCCCAPDAAKITQKVYKHHLTGCAHSYILHPRGAQKMLAALPMNECDGADHFMKRVFKFIRSWEAYAFAASKINHNHDFVTTHRYQSKRMIGC